MVQLSGGADGLKCGNPGHGDIIFRYSSATL